MFDVKLNADALLKYKFIPHPSDPAHQLEGYKSVFSYAAIMSQLRKMSQPLFKLFILALFLLPVLLSTFSHPPADPVWATVPLPAKTIFQLGPETWIETSPLAPTMSFS